MGGNGGKWGEMGGNGEKHRKNELQCLQFHWEPFPCGACGTQFEELSHDTSGIVPHTHTNFLRTVYPPHIIFSPILLLHFPFWDSSFHRVYISLPFLLVNYWFPPLALFNTHE